MVTPVPTRSFLRYCPCTGSHTHTLSPPTHYTCTHIRTTETWFRFTLNGTPKTSESNCTRFSVVFLKMKRDFTQMKTRIGLESFVPYEVTDAFGKELHPTYDRINPLSPFINQFEFVTFTEIFSRRFSKGTVVYRRTSSDYGRRVPIRRPVVYH